MIVSPENSDDEEGKGEDGGEDEGGGFEPLWHAVSRLRSVLSLGICGFVLGDHVRFDLISHKEDVHGRSGPFEHEQRHSMIMVHDILQSGK